MFTDMDKLVYSYGNSNQLNYVTDSGNNNYGFKDDNKSGNDYYYDANGSLIKDLNKGITSVNYNYMGMPTEVKLNNSDTQKVHFIYAADRRKVRKIKNENGSETITDYAGNFIYENNTLKQFSHPEGYVKNDNGIFSYVYNYTDHLGSVRLSYTDANNDGVITPSTEILQESNPYPFGLKQKGYNGNIIGSENNYKTYLGQEINKDLGLNWLSFRYRNYNPEIGRFFGVDPVSEDYLSISTYQFAHNSPVWKIELEGLEGAPTAGGDIVNHEPVNRAPIPIGDSTSHNYGTAQNWVTISSSVAPSNDIRSGQFNDGDFRGIINPASDAMYNSDPSGAVVQDVTFLALSFVGANAIDDAIATANDPNASALDVAEAAVNAALTSKGNKKGPNPNAKPRRPHLRKSTINKTWEANKNSNGKVIDPTGKEITWNKSKKRNGQWDMGHKPGHEFRKDWQLYKDGKLTWDQMKERYNDPDRYRPELPSTNRSHKYEEK